MKSVNIELLQKFLNNETDDKESEIVINWLKKNRLSEQDLKKLIEIPESVRLFEMIDPKKDWPIVRRKLFPKERQLNARFILRVAASVALLLGISELLFHWYNTAKQPIVYYNYSNNINIITLPDSSNAYLERNTKIVYYSSYIKNREVTIDGKIFFEVKRNEQKPFIIAAKESRVKVLGTSFSVNTQQKYTEVIVNSGKVALYSNDKTTDTLILIKGDKGIFRNQEHRLEKLKNDDLNYISWKTHVLTFCNTPMNRVISDLESYFGIKIYLENPTLSKLCYTSGFTNPSLKEILNEMELVLNIKCEKKNNNLIIISK